MKKNDWLLLLAVAAFSFLFYRQGAGVNYLIFTLLMLLLTFLQTSSDIRKQKSWMLVAGGSLLTAISIVVTNSGFAVLMNMVSLVLLAGFSACPGTSVFVAALNSLYSLSSSLVVSSIKRLNAPPQPEKQRTGIYYMYFNKQGAMTIGIPVVVCVVFTLIYASASAAFSYVLSQVRLDFISWGWVTFTVLGGILLYVFFHQLFLTDITRYDLQTGNKLVRLRNQVKRIFPMKALTYEFRTSFLLLIMLNVLLFIFILSDTYYLTLGTLPANVVYADFLHQGVFALIVSIILAIAVLLFVFRGNLNFYKHNKNLKYLAYLWLGLNMVLVLVTLCKNSIYVETYGLTYKRIGVYTYLTLTFIGLIFSYFKVAQIKNNLYLFRKNAWALYFVILSLSFMNWDRLITYYNLHVARSVDHYYLSTLSSSNLPEVAAAFNQKKIEYNSTQEHWLTYKINDFIQNERDESWQSWNYDDWRVSKLLSQVKPEDQFWLKDKDE